MHTSCAMFQSVSNLWVAPKWAESEAWRKGNKRLNLFTFDVRRNHRLVASVIWFRQKMWFCRKKIMKPVRKVNRPIRRIHVRIVGQRLRFPPLGSLIFEIHCTERGTNGQTKTTRFRPFCCSWPIGGCIRRARPFSRIRHGQNVPRPKTMKITIQHGGHQLFGAL